jgi:hypothetical protein
MPNVATELGLRSNFCEILRVAAAQERVLAREPSPPPRDIVRKPRVRRPSFREIEQQAGRPVTALTLTRDGSRTYAFGQQEAAKEAAPTEDPPRVALFKARLVPKQKVVL